MRTHDIPDAETVVGQYWPLDGPYTPDRTTTASSVAAELVRYLNYATGQGARDALPYAATIASVVGALQGAIGGMDQTLRQLASRCQTFTDDPTLYDHTHRDDHSAALSRVCSAMAALADARHAASSLDAALRSAHEHLNCLGHNS